MLKKTITFFILMAAIIFLLSCAQTEIFTLKSHPQIKQNQDWKTLITDDLSNFIYKPGTWFVKAGILTRKGGGYLWTKEKYSDFILDFEFKLSGNANTGVFLRAGNIIGRGFVHTSIEVQLLDDWGTDKKIRKHRPNQQCGSIYDCLAPAEKVIRKAGQWNRCTICCVKNKIYIVMNGRQIIDMDVTLWKQAHTNPDGSKNKFDYAIKDMPRTGHIGFQDHGDAVWFRNIRIKKLND